jgi:hypothetical protein
MKEERIHGAKSHRYDNRGGETFGLEGRAGKILHGVHTLDSANFAAVLGINLMGSDNLGYRLPDGKVRPVMQDSTMLLFTAVFFCLAFLYVKACQKLR